MVVMSVVPLHVVVVIIIVAHVYSGYDCGDYYSGCGNCSCDCGIVKAMVVML